jgi:hypothetical protein
LTVPIFSPRLSLFCKLYLCFFCFSGTIKTFRGSRSLSAFSLWYFNAPPSSHLFLPPLIYFYFANEQYPIFWSFSILKLLTPVLIDILNCLKLCPIIYDAESTNFKPVCVIILVNYIPKWNSWVKENAHFTLCFIMTVSYILLPECVCIPISLYSC